MSHRPLTIEDLLRAKTVLAPKSASAYLAKKPDPNRCMICNETMSEPAMPMHSGHPPITSIIGYLCGRCAVVVKQKLIYGPRQEAMNQ